MQYKGRIIFEGYAIADVLAYEEANKSRQKNLDHGGDEYERFVYARQSALKTFDELYETALKTVGEEKAALFQTYRLMAEDTDFEDLVRSNINDGQTAEDAINNASKQIADSFAILDDEYMKQRAADVIEVGKNLINVLSGNNELVHLTKPTILICNDLAASVLMRMDRRFLKGLVLINGNENSHVAIFARTLELPTICGLNYFNLSSTHNGKTAIVDAIRGRLVIEPTEDELKEYKELEKEYLDEGSLLKKYIGKPTVTKDGVKLKIYTNIASALEIENVKNNDGEGIGLFRSEFIYLASKTYPTEGFQFNYYREVLEEMGKKEVVIRTIDIGADKEVAYFNLAKEENPALGLRSIRICRKQPDVFYTQLRALYRASVYGNLSIMIPMIVSIDEVKFFKDMIKKVKEDLKKDNIPFNDKVKVGIMIETPAAAIMSDDLAKHVDFFSIGTNDLSQYTLACDRLNPALNDTFNKKHYAIMRLIKMTVENAHKAGITCSMCGELARDPEMLPFLAAIHIDELSCSCAYVLKTRKALAEIDSKKVDISKYLDPK
ncbi:MAG: phosphoenolpyruvate--protein phosphotransferase [Bacilli bacterium]|nr:phosphoenolpyruvate--protein phosphotransferase [Bacilli bacterium]